MFLSYSLKLSQTIKLQHSSVTSPEFVDGMLDLKRISYTLKVFS